ncbi:MAG TPA: hypothetical protein VLK84_25895, partial [Longimicrobium sp.]|nr:hypothetical protein [Longimicrobium sp.]
ARGAMASLLVGAVLGMGRLVAELNKASLDGWLYAYADINFLHFAAFLFVICSVVLIVVSYTAPAPSREQLAGLTFQTTPKGEQMDDAGSRREGVILSGLLVLTVIAIWLYFS